MYVCSDLKDRDIAPCPLCEDPQKKFLSSLSSRNNFTSPEQLVCSYFKDTELARDQVTHTWGFTYALPFAFLSASRMAPFRVPVFVWFSSPVPSHSCFLGVLYGYLGAICMLFWHRVGYDKRCLCPDLGCLAAEHLPPLVLWDVEGLSSRKRAI